MFLVVLEYAILASTFTLAKKALAYAPPFFLIAFRMTLAGASLLTYVYLFDRKKFISLAADAWSFITIAFFHIYIAFIFEFWALQYVSSIKTSIIYSTTPFFAALLSYMITHQRLKGGQWIALLIGMTGLLPTLMVHGISSADVFSATSFSWPEVALFISVISACYAWFLIKDFMKKGYSLLIINGYAMLLGGLLSFITSWIVEGCSIFPVQDTASFLVWTIALMIMANGISYNLYGWLLNFYSITFMSFAGFLCPLFAALFGWLFLGEEISSLYGVSFVLVTSGLYLFYRQENA
jgi:drug/metabolite transporter (DMT)-like permease